MDLEVIKSIWVDIERIIEDYELTNQSNEKDIINAIKDHVSEADDCDYYLIGEQEKEKIKKEIEKVLTNKR